MENRYLIFPFDWSDNYGKVREEAAIKESKKHIPEGWVSDDYFRSQESFFTEGEVRKAQVIIRRWI